MGSDDDMSSERLDQRVEVLALRCQVDSLRRRVGELQRFHDAIWSGAVERLESWALAEGIGVPLCAGPVTQGAAGPLNAGPVPQGAPVSPAAPGRAASQPGPAALSTQQRVPLSQEVRTALAETAALSAQAPPEMTERPQPGSVALRIERRSAPRYRVRHSLRFAATGVQRTAVGTVVEISAGALVIRTAQPPAPGTRVACGLYIGPESALELVLAKGRVVRLFDGPFSAGPVTQGAPGSPAAPGRAASQPAGPDGRGFVLRLDQLTADISRVVEFLAGTVVIEARRPRGDESTARCGARVRLAR